MSTPILTTKLHIPSPRRQLVLRPRLTAKLNEGLHCKLTLISAPAGFGKTTLVSEWIATCGRQAAWLSLDEGDNDPSRLLAHLVAALQTIGIDMGEEMLGMIQSPQLPPIEAVLAVLLHRVALNVNHFVLILDDYHVLDTKLVESVMIFLLEYLPPHMHLVIATREDPRLPLSRLRAGNQLTELRATDLSFTLTEAAAFFKQTMGLDLSQDDVAALESRTEGWIAGLQLAAISMQNDPDRSQFVKSFTGSHRFVLDYLAEEVLHRQSENVQNFLLHTSVLDRLCGRLCDTVLCVPGGSGQETLEYLDHANIFIIPLDNERRWFRYHHLFADLLRHRLQINASSRGDAERYVNELHIRASQWFEDNNLELEAFHHAAAGNDFERSERLIDGKGIPLHYRGAVMAILNWLASLPTATLNARPSLWWQYASLLLVIGQTTGVEEKLQAAEDALQDDEDDDKTRNLIGRIAAARATLALPQYQAENMLIQSRRALEFLSPHNLATRANAYWTMGYAYILQGNRILARQAFTEAIALSQASGDMFTTILATLGLGNVEETENQLHLAYQTYQHVVELAGDQPLSVIYEANLGLARILYEWNDLELAEQYGWQSRHLARLYEKVIDRFITCEVFLARLRLANGDVTSASAILAEAWQSARQGNFVYRIPEIAAMQVLTLLRQGNLTAAGQLVQTHEIPLSQARIHLVQGNTSAALAALEPLRQRAETKGWQDERLRIMALQAAVWYVRGEIDQALQVAADTLALAEPNGFIRLFIDEGAPMAHLLSHAAAKGIMPDYVDKLLAAFEMERQRNGALPPSHHGVELLSRREMEVLQLIAQGLSNREICERLFLALDTVKGHTRRIFDKLDVQRRTEAIARARELRLI